MGNRYSSPSTSTSNTPPLYQNQEPHLKPVYDTKSIPTQQCKACTGDDNTINYTTDSSDIPSSSTSTSTSTHPHPHHHTPHRHPPCVAYAESSCPLTRAEVGRCTWAYLHTIAAWYPQHAVEHQQQQMRDFMLLMASTYPCGYCSDTTVQAMRQNPPRVEGQESLSRWLCEVHNEVNERLGKARFDCRRVNERWRDGMAHCKS
jgi:FAD-linked sulfhydryl oxidase